MASLYLKEKQLNIQSDIDPSNKHMNVTYQRDVLMRQCANLKKEKLKKQ